MSNISSSRIMGQKKFSSIITILMIVPLFLTVISTSQAASIAGVNFSNDSINISPESPIAGTPISIKLTLNNSNTEISEVDVYFYKNSYEAGKEWKIEHVILSASDGITDSQTNVTVIWQGVNVDDDGIFIRVYDSVSDSFSPSVFKSFSVQGLPDLVIENVEITPNTNLHENDLFYANITVLNQGTETSESNSINLNIEGSGISETTEISALDADSSTIISFESLAPQTGTWTIQISVDSNYEVNELDEQNNNWNGNLVVTDIPDMYFFGGLVVTTTEASIASVNGPWTLSGSIFATEPNDIIQGTNIDVEILLVDSNSDSEIRLNKIIEWNSNSNQQMFTLDFSKDDINDFSAGTHDVSIIINPNIEYNGVNSNDIISSNFQLADSPNVNVNIISESTNNVVTVDSNISFYVNLENTGSVSSSGTLSANWRGASYGPYELTIGPNAVEIIPIEVETGSTKGEQIFSIMWQPDTNWMDSDNLDNVDQVTVNIEIPFLLNFDLYSVNITPNQPYIMGSEHTLLINVDSSDSGSQTIECRDKDDELINSKNLIFTEQTKRDLFECTFTPNNTGLYELKLIFVEEGGQDYTMTLQIDPPDSLLNIESEDTSDFLKLLIPFTLVLIIALIAGIILTRNRIDLSNVIYVDIENDGYDPEELNISIGDKVMWTNYDEDDKHTVSAKSLNEEGQLLFHSGDLEDHDEFLHEFTVVGKFEYGCKYNSKFYGVVNVFGLEDEDSDEIIKGSTQFASDIAEMGFNENELESDWDERISEAETEVENIRSKQEAELIEDEEINLDIEDENVKMKIDDEDSELISQRGKYNQNMEEILASKGELKALKDEDVELTASDAGMRAELYALTGEEGVMPGEEVKIGLGTNKDHLEGAADFVGNQLPKMDADFTFDDSEEPVKKEVEQKVKDEKINAETAECGGCGAEIPIDAKECQICGAKFE
jgi:plastocyanin